MRSDIRVVLEELVNGFVVKINIIRKNHERMVICDLSLAKNRGVKTSFTIRSEAYREPVVMMQHPVLSLGNDHNNDLTILLEFARGQVDKYQKMMLSYSTLALGAGDPLNKKFMDNAIVGKYNNLILYLLLSKNPHNAMKSLALDCDVFSAIEKNHDCKEPVADVMWYCLGINSFESNFHAEKSGVFDFKSIKTLSLVTRSS